MKPNVHTFLACEADYASARTVLFGAPFDGTTSFRPGTRFGPSAIRGESFGLESYSPYCNKDLADCRIYDGGDLELPFGSTEQVLNRIEQYTSKILADEKLPLMLGGEHLVSLGAFRAVYAKYPQVQVLHLDAHADLRTAYLGQELSHSTVIKQIWNLIGDGRIHQFGIRSGERDEFAFAKAHTKLHPFTLEGFAETVKYLNDTPVYVTIDLDVLDPAYFAGTGTPEPGGVSIHALLQAVSLLHQLNVVGCDINELSPHYDQSGASTAVACKITREILLQLTKEEDNHG